MSDLVLSAIAIANRQTVDIACKRTGNDSCSQKNKDINSKGMHSCGTFSSFLREYSDTSCLQYI